MRRLAPLLATLTILGAPATACAGTAAIVQRPFDVTLVYSAAAGEANRVVVTHELVDGRDSVVLHDAGAGVDAAAGCTSIDPHTVRCSAAASSDPTVPQGVRSILVLAGDGDVMNARTVRCGSGRDTVRDEPRGQLMSDCELLAFSNHSSRPDDLRRPAPTPRRPLRLRAKCVGPGPLISCDVRLRLRVDRSAPSRRSTVIAAGRTRSLTVKPRRPARRGAWRASRWPAA